MIFRLTHKMAGRISAGSLPTLPRDPQMHPLHDWNANLFVLKRTRFIMLTNSDTLYSILMPGKGITSKSNFARQALGTIEQHMTLRGLKEAFDALIGPATKEPLFSKTTDRRVLGSMNDFVFQSYHYLYMGDLTLEDISFRLNENPMSYLDMNCPNDVLADMLDGEGFAKDGDAPKRNNVVYMEDYRRSPGNV